MYATEAGVNLTVGLAVGVGVLLGLLGGGGSILTVPLLIYVAGMDTRAAIATSLLVIGVSSIAALIPHAVAGRVHWRAGALFGAAGIVGAQLSGRLARFVPEGILLGGFGLVMIFTAVALFRCRRCDGEAIPREKEVAVGKPMLWLQGFGIGALTGLVGVGGGFMIVPALTLFSRIPTRVAVGTSLMVISLNSLSGLAGHAGALNASPGFLVALTAACAAGSIGGSFFADRVPQRLLRRGFAVIVMAVALVGFVGRAVFAHTSIMNGGAAMFGFLKDKKVSAKAHDLVANGAALLDVRTREEFAAGSLPGAINIPVDELDQRAAEIGPASRPVVTFCRSGMRSRRAMATLERLGFEQVVNLGPKSAW